MNTITKPKSQTATLALQAETAADLMTSRPTCIRDVATIAEGLRALVDHGFSAAPVVDEAGRPIGVLSRADLLRYDRDKARLRSGAPEYYHKEDLTVTAGEFLGEGFQVEETDQTQVGDVMTPVIFSVPPDAPARRAVEDLVDLKVHRLFVVDCKGILVGVISALDVLRRLRP